jgi:hypothetical protein
LKNIFIAAVFIFVSVATCNADSLDFTFNKSIEVDYGGIWCVLAYDGENIVASSEATGLVMGKYDLSLNQIGEAVTVADSSDMEGTQIADHKHIFQNDYHYLVFSNQGSGNGGYLYLIKVDKKLQREKIVTVVSDDAPTNDMFLVGDGTNVYVGKFKPGYGHAVYKYDEDLNFVEGPIMIGGWDMQNQINNTHSNGAAVLYYNNMFHMIAPETLAPGDSDYFYQLSFDKNWGQVGVRQTIYEDTGNIGLVTGFSQDPITKNFIIHFTKKATGKDEITGPMSRLVYNTAWQQQSLKDNVITGYTHLPHSVVIDKTIFVGYHTEDEDGGNFQPHIDSFDYTVSETIPDVQINTLDGPVLIESSESLSFTFGLYPGNSEGTEADWWIVVLTPFGWYYYDGATSNWVNAGENAVNIAPSYQKAITSVASNQLFQVSGLPEGKYIFYFAIDAKNGLIDQDITYDSVEVTIQ